MKYQIAIGLPSYNEAERIGFVTGQIDHGLSKYFSSDSSLIVNMDSKSPDDTKSAFLATKTKVDKLYLEVGKGKGTALIDFWSFCSENKIPYAATIDADLKSITPEWISLLIQPLVDQKAEATLPLYARNRFGANITNQFAFPLVYSIFGERVRQPLAGEFGYSANFYRYLLKQPKIEATSKYGIDIFITCNALAGKFQILNPDLDKKIDKPSFYHQEETFLEVSRSAIAVTRNILEKSKNTNIKKSITIEGYCAIDKVEFFPHKKEIPELLTKVFIQYQENRKLNEKYLGNLSEIVKRNISKENVNINSELWTDVLAVILKRCYSRDFDLSDIDKVTRVLLPIYRWRVITFWLEVESKPVEEVEKILSDQADTLRKKLKLM